LFLPGLLISGYGNPYLCHRYFNTQPGIDFFRKDVIHITTIKYINIMKATIGKIFFPAVILLSLTVFFACQKETSLSSQVPAGQSKLSLFLTDGPFDFQKVLIDIKSIQVQVDTCRHFGDEDEDEHEKEHHDCDNEEGFHDNDQGHHDNDSSHAVCKVWSDLKINPGVYDLLKLRNGRDTLLGASFIPKGKIIKIKINLGPRDSIMADSVVHPLKIRDNKDFVIIKIRNEHLDSISANNFRLILDFDLARSIKFENGVYWLKPILKAFSKKNTGTIEGKVRPDSAFGMIKAFNATDTAFALPDREEEGEFKIRGLKEGTYSVLIKGQKGYLDSTITGVKVFRGHETDLGKIVLHK
jgi:hypothetical protein